MTLCNNNDQTWFSDTLTSARLLGVVKILAFQAQHLTLSPADVNAKKNMCNSYIKLVAPFSLSKITAYLLD